MEISSPSSDLLSKDPVTCAKVRFFINFISIKFNPAVIGFVMGGGPVEPALEAFDTPQTYLPPSGQGRFVLGDKFSFADISIAPFLTRCLVLLSGHRPISKLTFIFFLSFLLSTVVTNPAMTFSFPRPF